MEVFQSLDPQKDLDTGTSKTFGQCSSLSNWSGAGHPGGSGPSAARAKGCSVVAQVAAFSRG